MNILSLETSTEACSVAILNDQGQSFSEYRLTPREHTRYLPLMMDAVLAQAGLQKCDLTHVAYASGPGAFTGIRIATATAQGLAIGLRLPLVAISSLAVLAQHATAVHGVDKIVASLDARMGEAYVAHYQRNALSQLVELSGEERLVKLAQLEGPAEWFLVGSGFKAKREAGLGSFKSDLDEQIQPHATALAVLAKQAIGRGLVVTAGAAPINYIRNKVAEKKKVVSL